MTSKRTKSPARANGWTAIWLPLPVATARSCTWLRTWAASRSGVKTSSASCRATHRRSVCVSVASTVCSPWPTPWQTVSKAACVRQPKPVSRPCRAPCRKSWRVRKNPPWRCSRCPTTKTPHGRRSNSSTSRTTSPPLPSNWLHAKVSSRSSMSNAIPPWVSVPTRASWATSTAWPSRRARWASAFRKWAPPCSAPTTRRSPSAPWLAGTVGTCSSRCASPRCMPGT
ncbi:hypothetical protein D3C76_803350 [compost metagenome]